MPELPEVETIAEGLRRGVRGRRITEVVVLFPAMLDDPEDLFRRRLLHGVIERVYRRGKMLIADLSTGYSLIVHLGMTGRLLLLAPSSPVEKHTHFILGVGPDLHLRYQDVRRFGFIRTLPVGEVQTFLEDGRLGREPFEITVDELAGVLASRRTGLKALLLGQTVVAGIGNIYADEILHRCGIHPLQPACGLTEDQVERLHSGMRAILEQAIKDKGSSVSDYVDAAGNNGSYQNRHAVYRRTGRPCPACGTPIVREVIAGRSTHYCPKCQVLRKR